MYPRATRKTKLTITQEKFAREYLRHNGNGTAAAMAVANYASRDSAGVVANYYLKKPHVRRKIAELRAKMVKRLDITVEKVLTDYQDALNIAKSQERASDMVAAATAQAKLVGLLRDRLETGNAGDFDHLDDISAILEKVAAEAGPEAAQALYKALGYSEVDMPEKDEAFAELKPASDAVN